MAKTPPQTLQHQLDHLFEELKPHGQTLLKTMLENSPKDIETLISRGALETFFRSCDQMIYQRLSMATERLMESQPMPRPAPGRPPSMTQRMSHYVSLEMQAMEAVLHPLLAMTLVELEMDMLTDVMEPTEAEA